MKYSIIEDSKTEYKGRTFYQIQAEETRNGIVKGTIGGFIESTNNLDMSSDAWITQFSYVGGDVRITNDTLICGVNHIFNSKDIISLKTEDNVITVLKDSVTGKYKVISSKGKFSNEYDFFVSKVPYDEEKEEMVIAVSALHDVLLRREAENNG